MALYSLVEGGQRLSKKPTQEWPWSWVRLLGLCRTVKSVYERASYDEDKHSALPPKWMWWEPERLDEWFDERRASAQERAEERRRNS